MSIDNRSVDIDDKQKDRWMERQTDRQESYPH